MLKFPFATSLVAHLSTCLGSCSKSCGLDPNTEIAVFSRLFVVSKIGILEMFPVHELVTSGENLSHAYIERVSIRVNKFSYGKT